MNKVWDMVVLVNKPWNLAGASGMTNPHVDVFKAGRLNFMDRLPEWHKSVPF